MNACIAPNLEERLSAAAFTILTDGRTHDRRAQAWARRFLRVAAGGRETEFQRRASRPRAHLTRGA